MSLADAIAAAKIHRGGKCSVGQLVDGMSKADQTDFAACMADPRISAPQIVRGLRAEGYVVTRNPLERHRRGECACGTR